jgi:repressor LexA
MKGLTEKQRKMLDFIEGFQEKESMSPTVYEIADHFDIKTSTVFAHIRALQRKGFLVRSSKARSISLTKPRKKPKQTLPAALTVPLVGRIKDTERSMETKGDKEGDLYCDPAIFKGEDMKKIFALKVSGESMKDMGILDGDIVIVKQANDVEAGSVAVALVDGETTVKTYYPKGDLVELHSANSEFEPRTYSADQVKLQGVVIGLQRKY